MALQRGFDAGMVGRGRVSTRTWAVGGGRKKIGGHPSRPAYFKQNVVTRTPAVHRKVQANNVKK